MLLSLLRVLKIVILMLAYKCPRTPLKISLPENETMVNLKSASFVIIMFLHEGLTHIQSQMKPWLLFRESFTLGAGLQRQNSLNDEHIFFHLPGSGWRFFFTTLCTFRHQSITCTSKNPHSAMTKTHCSSCKMYLMDVGLMRKEIIRL